MNRMGRVVIWWNAIRDRKHNLPAPTATALSATESRIQAAVNLSIRDLQDAYAKATEKLKARLAAALAQLQNVENPEFERLIDKTGRYQEHVSLGPLGHRLLMTCLSVGEAAFNLLAFEILREPTMLTILMGLAVAVAIPLLAYKTGIVLRQYEPLSRKIVWAVSLVGIALATLVAINSIRAQYLQVRVTGIGDTSNTALIYFLVNSAIFAAATIVTYLSKDPEVGFLESKQRVERRNAEVMALRGRLNELGERLTHQVGVVHEAGRQAIAFYRGVNRRGRTAVPAYFDHEEAPNHTVTFLEVAPARYDEEATPSRSLAVLDASLPLKALPTRLRGVR